MNRLTVFDSTLASVPFLADKLSFALSLARAGVDVIDFGYPTTSEANFVLAQELTGQLEKTQAQLAVSSFPDKELIRRTASVFETRNKGILQLAFPVSDNLIESKCGCYRKELLDRMTQAVEFACKHASVVMVQAEDATLADREFLFVFCKDACAAGAKIISLQDTQGVASPISVRQLLKILWMSIDDLRSRRCQLSFHARNDRGLALANSLSSVYGGCEIVETALSGLGPGVGTTPTEEFALTLADKQEEFSATSNLNPARLGDLAKALHHSIGLPPHPSKPLIGRYNRKAQTLRLECANEKSEILCIGSQIKYQPNGAPKFKVIFSIKTLEGETDILGYGERLEDAVLVAVQNLQNAPTKVENVEANFFAGKVACYAEIEPKSRKGEMVAIEQVGGSVEVCLFEMCLEVMRCCAAQNGAQQK
jgi:hypothetical protein